MTKEKLKDEIKKELLNNDQEQSFITIQAQIISLTTQLIKKGIFKTEDLDEMSKTTNEYIEIVNERIVDKALKELEDLQDE